jgi:hypothetical protein
MPIVCRSRTSELCSINSMTMKKAYLEITLTITGMERTGAAAVFYLYRDPFLRSITGALSKELLVHPEQVQVLHGFDSETNARAYLLSEFFNQSVVSALLPYLLGSPDIKVYTVA